MPDKISAKTGTPFTRIRDKSRKLPLKVLAQHSILSDNKVTGSSVNFPIYSTCQPSKVCAQTCYALTGPITWSASLNKQKINEHLCKESPEHFAGAVIQECKRHISRDPAFFLRWNGTGDLFEESIESLTHISEQLPELPIWVVTRIPRYAHKLLLQDKSNIYVHFSLDKHSMSRRLDLLSLLDGVMPDKLFFSYQCDKNEDYSFQEFASVVFIDKYKPRTILPEDEAICPLNKYDDITGMCARCRRCFNGAAASHSSNIHN